MKIAVIYGSTTGNTENAAGAIKEKLSAAGEVVFEQINRVDFSTLSDVDVFVFGSSTWGMGELQDDWYGKESFTGVDMAGKKVAVFGTGDQSGYCDSFADSLGIIAKSAQKAGATIIGKWPTDGYDFTNSEAVEDGNFLGLALDDDNQPELTEERIDKWTQQLISEM